MAKKRDDDLHSARTFGDWRKSENELSNNRGAIERALAAGNKAFGNASDQQRSPEDSPTKMAKNRRAADERRKARYGR